MVWYCTSAFHSRLCVSDCTCIRLYKGISNSLILQAVSLRAVPCGRENAVCSRLGTHVQGGGGAKLCQPELHFDLNWVAIKATLFFVLK
jgi:hypothetical protein